MGDDDFYRGSLGNHAAQPVRQPGRMRIILHSALQAARLAHIERVALAIEHAVYARMAGILLSASRMIATPAATPVAAEWRAGGSGIAASAGTALSEDPGEGSAKPSGARLGSVSDGALRR